jgi:uncharacterized protein (DUF779 family)
MAARVPARVTATPEALAVIGRLRVAHGPLAFFQSGGCCDGTAPMCFGEHDMPPSAQDVKLGEIGGAPFYIDGEQDERWGRPAFLIDVADGPAQSFSLEGLEGVHFVTRTAAGEEPAGPDDPLSCAQQ